MKPKEIRELLVLKEWSRENLADQLGITRNTVDRWFVEEGLDGCRYPSRTDAAKMWGWLTEAREETRNQPA